MDRMLGEVVEIEQLKEKDLVWIDREQGGGEYVPVEKVSLYEDDFTAVRVDFLDGWVRLYAKGDKVIRGHYYLGVARRVT